MTNETNKLIIDSLIVDAGNYAPMNKLAPKAERLHQDMLDSIKKLDSEKYPELLEVLTDRCSKISKDENENKAVYIAREIFQEAILEKTRDLALDIVLNNDKKSEKSNQQKRVEISNILNTVDNHLVKQASRLAPATVFTSDLTCTQIFDSADLVEEIATEVVVDKMIDEVKAGVFAVDSEYFSALRRSTYAELIVNDYKSLKDQDKTTYDKVVANKLAKIEEDLQKDGSYAYHKDLELQKNATKFIKHCFEGADKNVERYREPMSDEEYSRAKFEKFEDREIDYIETVASEHVTPANDYPYQDVSEYYEVGEDKEIYGDFTRVSEYFSDKVSDLEEEFSVSEYNDAPISSKME